MYSYKFHDQSQDHRLRFAELRVFYILIISDYLLLFNPLHQNSVNIKTYLTPETA